jgi:hypothetical protein
LSPQSGAPAFGLSPLLLSAGLVPPDDAGVSLEGEDEEDAGTSVGREVSLL